MTVARFFEVSDLNVHDTSPILTPVRLLLTVLSAAAFCLTFLLATKGWCIIRDDIPLREFIACACYSLAFICLGAPALCLNEGPLQIASLFLTLIFVVLFIRELFSSVNDASLRIVAHLLAISNAGIDPETTPIYKKHKMYQRLHSAIVLGCVLLLLKVTMVLIVPLDFWIDEVITDGIVITGLAAFAAIFRLREVEVFGYDVIEENDRNEYSLAEIESARGDFGHGGRKWESGMRLPLMPNLVEERTVEDQLVVLSGPQGTEIMNGRVFDGKDYQ
jgi:hypothetical protein